MKQADVTELKQLAKLRKEGVLSAKEFAAEKARILKAGGQPLEVLRPTWRFFWVNVITFGGYWYRLIFVMRRHTNELAGVKGHPLLHAGMAIFPVLVVYPFWRLSQDLQAAHHQLKLRWPLNKYVEWVLLAAVLVAGIGSVATIFYEEVPLWLGLVVLASLIAMAGYLIRLLWSYNDAWRKKLGQKVAPSRAAGDVGWSYVWTLGVFGVLMLAAFTYGLVVGITNPELNDCYDREYEQGEELGRIEDRLDAAVAAGDQPTVSALQGQQNVAEVRLDTVSNECLEIEDQVFAF